MYDDVRAVLEGFAQIGRRHRVVDDQGQAVPVREGCHLLDVGHVALWIAERLHEYGLRPVVDQALEGLGFAVIGESALNAVLRQGMGEEVVCAAVQRAGGNEVVSRLRDGEDCVRGRRLPGGQCQRGDAALEGGQPLLEHVLGRIHDAAVDVAGHLEIEQVGPVLRAVEGVRHGLVQRYGYGFGDRIRGISAMDGDGVEAPMISRAGCRHMIPNPKMAFSPSE